MDTKIVLSVVFLPILPFYQLYKYMEITALIFASLKKKTMRFLILFCLFTLTIIARAQYPSSASKTFISEEVEVKAPQGHVLSGTLTLPTGKGPFACAVMITGSGPQNRDEEILGHKPFEAIAHHLAEKGIAVLRCDDRGVAKSTGDHESASSKDFADDILTQISFLQKEKKKKIRANGIGLIGHSEGGLIAAMVGARQSDLAFIVSLAGPGVNGRDILYKQNYDVTRAEGLSADEAAKNRDNVMKMLDIVIQNQSAEAEKKLHLLLDSLYSNAAIPQFEEFKKAQIESMNTDWMRYFLTYDPAKDWEKVSCPVLALNGEKDLQVDAKINLNAIAAALEKGNNYQYQTIVFPGMNHLFQSCKTCTISEYGQLEESISPLVLTEISDYLVKFAHAAK